LNNQVSTIILTAQESM